MINRILLRLTEMFSRYKKNITFKIDLRKKGNSALPSQLRGRGLLPKRHQLDWRGQQKILRHTTACDTATPPPRPCTPPQSSTFYFLVLRFSLIL